MRKIYFEQIQIPFDVRLQQLSLSISLTQMIPDAHYLKHLVTNCRILINIPKVSGKHQNEDHTHFRFSG